MKEAVIHLDEFVLNKEEFTLKDKIFLDMLNIDFDTLEKFYDCGETWIVLKKDGKETYRNYIGLGNIPYGLFQGLKKEKIYTRKKLVGLLHKRKDTKR